MLIWLRRENDANAFFRLTGASIQPSVGLTGVCVFVQLCTVIPRVLFSGDTRVQELPLSA